LVTFLGLEGHPTERPIIVLTHKEAAILRWGSVKPKNAYRPGSAIRREVARRAFKRLQKSCSFGVHIGGRVGFNHPAYSKHFSFILGNPLMEPPGDERFISLPSAYLSLEHKSALPMKRLWDIAAVGTSARYKRWPEFFHTTVELLRRRESLKVLAVMLPADRQQQVANLKLFQAIVPERLQPNFAFINLLPLWPEKGLPNIVLRELLAQCKVFALFSEMEWTSKVLVEALGSGCRTVTNKVIKHKAGLALPPVASDRFDPIQFTEGNELGALEDALDSFSDSYSRRAARVNRERFSFENGIQKFRRRYAEITGVEAGALDTADLHLRLDSHVRSPLWPDRVRPPASGTSDVLTAWDWQVLGNQPLDKIRQLCSPET